MSDPEADQRLEKIESSLAHVERLYEQLNEVVVKHAEALRRIQVQLQRIGASVEEMEGERIRSTNPKPPHHH